MKRECRMKANGEKIDRRHLKAIGCIKQDGSGFQLLFEQLPAAYGLGENYILELPTYIRSLKDEYDALLDGLKQTLIRRTKAMFSEKPIEAESRASLAAIISDWNERLDPKTNEQLFSDGTHRLLELFKAVPNDEAAFIARLAKRMTDLRLEDWDDSMLGVCLKKLQDQKATAEAFHSVDDSKDHSDAAIRSSGYQVTFPTHDGRGVTKRFEFVQYGPRGKLLYNRITDTLSSMGQALSEQEKRQILMEILQELC